MENDESKNFFSKIQVQNRPKTATITKAEYKQQENQGKDREENVSTSINHK